MTLTHTCNFLYRKKNTFQLLQKWIGEQRYVSVLKNQINLTYDYIGRSTPEVSRRKLNVEESESKTECVKLDPVFSTVFKFDL